jgi:hypothetical protein
MIQVQSSVELNNEGMPRKTKPPEMQLLMGALQP